MCPCLLVVDEVDVVEWVLLVWGVGAGVLASPWWLAVQCGVEDVEDEEGLDLEDLDEEWLRGGVTPILLGPWSLPL